MDKYGLDEKVAMRKFITSETYKMLVDKDLEIYIMSPDIIFDMWEVEQVTGDPRNSLYLRMNMSKEMDFFIYLLERYAEYKNTTAADILNIWDKLELTDFIYNMYEIYHVECLENAFVDIDKLVAEKQ